MERTTDDGVWLAVRLPHSWCIASVDAIIEVAELADELDMDVSVQDHLLAGSSVAPCGHVHAGEDRVVFEGHTTLAFVAARTRRARLIAGVYVLPYHHPLWLAKETSSLDALSQGRLIVGVGVGALRGRSQDKGQNLGAHQGVAVREFDAFGIQGHRGRMMDEYIRILDALWTNDTASYEGEFVSFEDNRHLPQAGVSTAPAHLDRWAFDPGPGAGSGSWPTAGSRVSRRSRCWPPAERHISQVATDTGRPMPSMGINIFVAVDADGERARDAMREALGHRFEGDGPLFEATFAGTPDEVRAHMQRYVDAGVTTFDLKYLPLTLESTTQQMRLVATEVLPGLAGAAGRSS